jgi:CBS domain-containing protein
VAGGGEAGDVADLGDDEEGDEGADAGDAGEDGDARVAPRARLDLPLHGGELAVEVGDEREQALEPPAGRSLIVICLPDRLTDFGRLVGILTERDLLATVAGRVQTSEARVREWMTENPVTVPEATPIGRAASIMVTHNFRHLPIVDGERTIGIVSLRDVVRSVVRAYPEYEDEGE